MKKIVSVHLLNDYSGSPLVLSQAVKGLIEDGHEVDIYTNRNSDGFLSNISGANYFLFNYSWGKSKMVTLTYFFFSQFFLFFRLLKYYRQDVVIYVNTVLPFGAALAGKCMNKKVVYHIHETSIKPQAFKSFLLCMVRYTASAVIYVSEYLKNKELISGKKNFIVYNALSDAFVEKSQTSSSPKENHQNVLMLCSLKRYKGVEEFIQLAFMLPQYSFTLVLNSSRAEIDAYLNTRNVPFNITIFSVQKDVHAFFKEADLVLNLSLTDQWIETFGMTILEAMSYGLPVIVPPVGGIAELVSDEFNGFKTDSKNIESIAGQIERIFSNKSFYNYLSFNARKRSQEFSNHTFVLGIRKAITS
ncbi:glycosyltransferase family 4 protein [Flavobacterium sp.]|uniref:glycosyltransferase family 4 protein n=1 Tax=Flavobacterium sp. TaxID=239 RepID=UPI0025BD1A68|nr:glycosyltransferase family 4 protein [Flavobacterium sp.]